MISRQSQPTVRADGSSDSVNGSGAERAQTQDQTRVARGWSLSMSSAGHVNERRRLWMITTDQVALNRFAHDVDAFYCSGRPPHGS
jgi:hypothetical protein